MIDLRIEAKAPFTQAEISEIERIIQRPLPQDYRDFVGEYGGAFVGGAVDGVEEFHISGFFDASEVLDHLESYTDLRDDGVLPFGGCVLGNLYVLVEKNEVWYINYYGGQTTVHKVAESFGDMLGRIIISEE